MTAALERWLWTHADDWLGGKPGHATLRQLSERSESEIPPDFLTFLAPELSLSGSPVLSGPAMQVAGHALAEESRQREAALRVSDAFHHDGVPHLFVKGTDFRYRVYPGPHRRISNDLDVLCAPDRRTRAAETLERIGADVLDPPEPFLDGRHHELSTRLGPVAVDLHTAMLQHGRSRMDTDEILGRGGSIPVEGGTLPVASREDSLALCLIHIGRHEGASEYVDLKHGLDVALAIRAWPDLDWPELSRRVTRWRCRRLAGAGLWTWRPVLGELLPGNALRLLDPGPIQRRLALRTRAVLSRPRVRARGALRLSQLGRKLAFAEGWRERWWLVGELARRILAKEQRLLG